MFKCQPLATITYEMAAAVLFVIIMVTSGEQGRMVLEIHKTVGR